MRGRRSAACLVAAAAAAVLAGCGGSGGGHRPLPRADERALLASLDAARTAAAAGDRAGATAALRRFQARAERLLAAHAIDPADARALRAGALQAIARVPLDVRTPAPPPPAVITSAAPTTTTPAPDEDGKPGKGPKPKKNDRGHGKGHGHGDEGGD
ncbi:MAG TPA: hypothetical protein VKD47_02530 [Miltoncostaeaceae bacterium]|nr:hypothetical protein [Miltoncostaeaceae bacterium]